jgi:DNA-binding NarL/FixJ family response regulator
MLLEVNGRLRVAGAVNDAHEAISCIEACHPQLVILNISMRGMDGLGALREIKRRAPGIRALVLAITDREDDLNLALQAGADGYLLMESSRAELLVAVAALLDGKRFISAAIASQIVGQHFERTAPFAVQTRFDTLTAREKQVLKLIAEGRRNRDIAKYLFISVKTVEKHRSNLMHKTNLHNTAALTSLAMEKGLVGNPARAAPLTSEPPETS